MGMYFDDFARLKALYRFSPGRVPVDEMVDIVVLPFRSDHRVLRLAADGTDGRGVDAVAPSLAAADCDVRENARFTYPVMMPSGTGKAGAAILLFHGLNEKSWDKYLPWARELCVRTGKAVVLFPIAFHIEPGSDGTEQTPGEMSRAATERQRRFGRIEAASSVNVALSTRLKSRPVRFILSGLETCNDVIRLVTQIRSRAPSLYGDARIGGHLRLFDRRIPRRGPHALERRRLVRGFPRFPVLRRIDPRGHGAGSPGTSSTAKQGRRWLALLRRPARAGARA